MSRLPTSQVNISNGINPPLSPRSSFAQTPLPPIPPVNSQFVNLAITQIPSQSTLPGSSISVLPQGDNQVMLNSTPLPLVSNMVIGSGQNRRSDNQILHSRQNKLAQMESSSNLGSSSQITGYQSRSTGILTVNEISSSQNLKPTIEIMNREFEAKNYHGIISNSGIENELLQFGYQPKNKVIIKDTDGNKRTQYIKTINKKGQKLFVIIDSNGYTTSRSSDLYLIESLSCDSVPYSLKTGAYNLVGKDASGVAFECGSKSMCFVVREPDELKPREMNYTYDDHSMNQNASSLSSGSQSSTCEFQDLKSHIMTYPVIRLTEIRANPDLILQNTDIVTRRLRNEEYKGVLNELSVTHNGIDKLNLAFNKFNNLQINVADKLYKVVDKLEILNSRYTNNPPFTDDDKDTYSKIQLDLIKKNENITLLLRAMKKIADCHHEINDITKRINDMTEFCEKEFVNVDTTIID